MRNWQVAEDEGVEEREKRSVGANAERKGEDGDGGEAGMFAEYTEGEGDVLRSGFEEAGAAGFAGLLFDGFEGAEIEIGAAAGFIRGDAAGDVVGDLFFEMETQFGVELLFGSFFVDEASKPVHDANSGI